MNRGRRKQIPTGQVVLKSEVREALLTEYENVYKTYLECINRDPVGSLTQAHMGAVAEVRFILTHYFDVDVSTFTAINNRLAK